ncbi:flavin reductase family protein [Plantactinospora sp. S1510]|uniref:Flavin reductase family protein n=1 Tax=Plantactinospora alkalitolerans TaxID=2789879 RepID=A0ABS0GWU6_9ACTN|nr:flavin reductase family protein [Plantactinospora alkalitolerans]MBF9130661.1 flavin reductase family protein [Plantactinospora alkalitolerans]
MHIVPGLKVLYFGTPVVLISSRNSDGTANLAPMSSAWWLNQSAMLGLGNSGQTTANLLRERECVLNLPSSSMVDAVDRIALTTGKRAVPEHKLRQGYRYEPDKFSAAGLTEQASELVRAPRVAECPIQLECRVRSAHPFGDPRPECTAFEVEVLRTHVEERLLIPGTHYVDPAGWDPLIMKFCEFFGGGQNVHPSRLADGWNMPHHLPVASSA